MTLYNLARHLLLHLACSPAHVVRGRIIRRDPARLQQCKLLLRAGAVKITDLFPERRGLLLRDFVDCSVYDVIHFNDTAML